jgi:hypothetical protein
MTKEKFYQYEAICKRAWKWLAKTGSKNKPRYLDQFVNECPACSIADIGGGRNVNCRICPIIAWRRQAMRFDDDQEGCVCLQDDHPFAVWSDAVDIEERKAAAKQISEMKWGWLKAYKNSPL